MSQLEQQMRHRDREMVPRALVIAMFVLMAFTLAIAAYASFTDRPKVGVLDLAPVEQTRSVTLTGDRSGNYVVTDVNGALLATSDDPRAGFLGVMGRVIDRKRNVARIGAGTPVDVMRRANGQIAIHDPATGFTVELVGYGRDNVAAFARLLD